MGNSFTSSGTTFFTPGCKNGQLVISAGLNPPFIEPSAIICPPGFLTWSGIVDSNGNPTAPVTFSALGVFPTFTLAGAAAANLNPAPTALYQWVIPLPAFQPPAQQLETGGWVIQLGPLFAWAWTGAQVPTPGSFGNLQIVTVATAGLA